MRITRKPVYAVLAGAGILLGAAGLTSAATTTDPSTPRTADQAEADDGENGNEADGNEADDNEADDNEADDGEADDGEADDGEADDAAQYTSSITIADDAEATNEADERATLEGLATITADEAAAAALAAQPGTVGDVELENEDGDVVYGVEVDTSAGKVEVTIDAGNGSVLATETDDD